LLGVLDGSDTADSLAEIAKALNSQAG
jgi:hypothetical protein